MGRITRMARYRAVYLVYRPYHLEFPLVSVPFQRKIHSDKDNISSYQYCAVCCYAVLYGKFGAGFGKGFCFSEFGRCKDRQDASPRIDCVGLCTHNGSSSGASSISTVAELCPDSTVLTDDYFTYSGNNVDEAESAVDEWLTELGYNN